MADGILIKAATVLTFPQGFTGEADIKVKGGLIQKIGRGLRAESYEVLDASGCIVAPGLVEMHAHLREPGME